MTKAERTRTFIIEKTASLFNKKGFAGTSLTDITFATGLTKGSIYSNFANKDEVALAAFDYNFKKLQAIISRQMKKKKTIRAQLLVYAEIYDRFLRHPFLGAGCPIQNTATEADDTHPILREKAMKAIISWKESLTGMIRRGIEENEFHNAASPEVIAFSIIAMIEGGIMIAKLTGKSSDQRAIRTSLEKIILDL